MSVSLRTHFALLISSALFTACGNVEIGIERTTRTDMAVASPSPRGLALGIQPEATTPTAPPRVSTPSSIATPSMPPVSTSVVVVPSATPNPDWTSFMAEVFALQIQYPAHWQPTAAMRFSATDGFLQLGTLDFGFGLADTCRHETERASYGSAPSIETLTIDQQLACLILPSPDQGHDNLNTAALIVRYPPTVKQSYSVQAYAAIWADPAHIRAIADSLRFFPPMPNVTLTAPPPASLLSFTVDRSVVNPGDTVTFSWSVAGTSGVWLQMQSYGSDGNSHAVHQQMLPATGTFTYTFDRERDRDDKYLFYLIAEYAAPIQGPANNSLLIIFPCETPLFFSPPISWSADSIWQGISRDTCGAASALTTQARAQAFEHGLMIQFQSDPRIYILVDRFASRDNGPSWWSVEDNWVSDGSDNDPETAPPAGKFRPNGNFWHVWSGHNPNVSELFNAVALGWATVPEETFFTSYQRGRTTGNLYFRDQQSQVIMLSVYVGHGATPFWERLD